MRYAIDTVDVLGFGKSDPYWAWTRRGALRRAHRLGDRARVRRITRAGERVVYRGPALARLHGCLQARLIREARAERDEALGRAERYAALLTEAIIQTEATGRMTPELVAYIRSVLSAPSTPTPESAQEQPS